MLDKIFETFFATIIPFCILCGCIYFLFRFFSRNSKSSKNFDKKLFRQNYYDSADDFENLDVYENIDKEDDDDFSFNPRRMTNREYDDYFGTLYDDAMNGDESARSEMQSEFGDNWKDEY